MAWAYPPGPLFAAAARTGPGPPVASMISKNPGFAAAFDVYDQRRHPAGDAAPPRSPRVILVDPRPT
jgi:hypothetical protein